MDEKPNYSVLIEEINYNTTINRITVDINIECLGMIKILGINVDYENDKFNFSLPEIDRCEPFDYSKKIKAVSFTDQHWSYICEEIEKEIRKDPKILSLFKSIL